jgi:hypothetical protein
LCLLFPRGFRLLTQDFLGERIRHVDDGSIDAFLIGAQGQEIRRNPHDDIHERQADDGGKVVRDRSGRMKKAGGEMRNQIGQRHFNFTRRKLAQDHVHRETDFRGSRTRRFKMGQVRRQNFLRQTPQDHADGEVDSTCGGWRRRRGKTLSAGRFARCATRKDNALGRA